MNLASVVQRLKVERERAAKEVQRLDAALAALGSTNHGSRTAARRPLSAAARARIAAAQRARWAKVRAGSQKQNVVTIPKKKSLSRAARMKIAAAQRARWAKVKAGNKAAKAS